MFRKRTGRFLFILQFAACLIALGATTAAAQEFRGSITGVVKDSSGGVLPGVTIVVTNTGTKVSQTLVTDDKGVYRALLLNAGTYSVTAQLSGFKKMERAVVEVRVSEATAADFTLQPGGVTETIEVTAETPILIQGTGITSTTVDAKQIAQLPLGDGTAYMLTRLAPGIMDSSDLHFSRPMDNGNLSGIVANGVQGGNEFTIDGAANLSNTKGVGFSPPSDAISQFKVQTNSFDAQAGHTAGAVVNLALKSGTNRYSFQTGYFNRDDSRSATPLLTERAGASKPTRDYNRYTMTLTGPVVRNKTFFMGSYEHLRDVQPEPATYTVPTDLMRQGDFSEFTTLIYDPRTTTSTGARTAFANNKIPGDRIDPVAAAYTKLYPEANLPGTSLNYFTNQLRPYDYDAYLGRLDHNVNGANRVFASAYYNKRQEDRYNWAAGATNADASGAIDGIAVTQGYDYRSNLGINGGWTDVLSNNTVFDLRSSYTKFGEWRDPAQTINPAQLGFSADAVSQMGNYQYMPFITIGSFSSTNSGSTIASLGSQRSDWNEGFNRPMKILSAAPTVTKVWSQHTGRAGYDLRWMNWQITNAGYGAGRYAFNGIYTRANALSGSTNDRAQSFAQFLLGLPTASTGAVATTSGTPTSQFEISAFGNYNQINHGFWLQDDWRVNGNLTVNAGLRIEVNQGMTEAGNRNLSGFDLVSDNPIEATAQARYAAAPIAQIPADQFQVNGGLLFANGPINETKTKLLPRLAASYAIKDKTVLRGGVGMFSYDYFFENTNQAGFSQATPVLVSNDNGITFTGASLTNPLPGQTLIQPVGSANGLASQLGQSLGTIYQENREVPMYTRWEASLQHDFGHGLVGMLLYVGSRGSSIPVVRAINNIPMQYLSTSRTRDAALETLLGQNVTSPFQGLLPGSTINGATVARSQLLRPYPEFQAISVEEYGGSDSYQGVTVQVEKRFMNANSVTFQYTRSNTRDKLNFLNPQDGILEDRVSPNDRPNRLSLSWVYRLPWGHGEKWGANWNAWQEGFLGGWQTSATYQYQSGFPLVFGNVYWDESCGDPKTVLKSNMGKLSNGTYQGLDSPAWDLSCFYFHDAAVQTNGVDDPAKQRADSRINLNNNVRYFPSTLPGVRTDNLQLLDLGFGKYFKLKGGATIQARVEIINALNYTVLWNPGVDPKQSTFGIINQDRNNPRDIQLGVRFTF